MFQNIDFSTQSEKPKLHHKPSSLKTPRTDFQFALHRLHVFATTQAQKRGLLSH